MVTFVNITGTHIILVFVVLAISLLFMLHQLLDDFKFFVVEIFLISSLLVVIKMLNLDGRPNCRKQGVF